MMEDRINELEINKKKIFVKTIILFILMLSFTVFGLPLCINIIGNYLLELFNLELLVIYSSGFLMWGLIDAVLYKLCKKSCEELELNYKECLEINCKIEHDKAIDNIKKRFDCLSKDKQVELLNFIRDDNEIKRIFLDINTFDLHDRENLCEYFFDSCSVDRNKTTDDCVIKSQRPADESVSYTRKRCLRTERKCMNLVDYNDNGQLQY